MNSFRHYMICGFIWMMALVSLSGCVSTTPSAPGTPVPRVMKSPSQFVVNDTVVDSSQLVKVLKKNRVPKNDPLVIEMNTSMPFDSIRILTQKLASAGYKPIFKSPRYADATTKSPGQHPTPSRIQRP